MLKIRSVTGNDVDDVVKLAFTARSGMLNLPKNRKVLHKKIEESVAAFATDIKKPNGEFYAFVLEDEETGTIAGASAIKASTGVETPAFYYRKSYERRRYPSLKTEIEIPTLTPFSETDGPTEVCSLYLLPRYRKGGLGRLLALSRYLYIAAHPHRFQKRFFALLRGLIDHNGTSLFWNHLGRHFLPLDYREVERLLIRSEAFIPEIIPKHPLYIPLLPKKVQHALGCPHPNALPAKKMLLAEGYMAVNEYDIFDGGPRFVANLRDIRAFRKQKEASISAIQTQRGRPPKYFKHIVGNVNNPFIACYGDVKEKGDGVIINNIVAETLQVSKGDLIRYVTIKG